MTRSGKTTVEDRSEAHLYLGKAARFLEEARIAISGQRYDASMLSSVHAGISASDAVTVALSGRRSTDPDHMRAADLLESVGAGSEIARHRAGQLRMLIRKKNAVEYDSRRATAGEAAQALNRAERIVGWAGEVIAEARV